MLHYTKIERHPGGEWVVFLHGIGGGSGIWMRQVREFRKHFNLLLIDLPGHGNSEYGLHDMEEKSFNAVSKEILKVLDYENVSSAHFVGISLGTILVQSIHDLEPKRVKSMVLGGAVEKFTWFAKLIIGVAESLKRFVPYMWLYKICSVILMPRRNHKESRLAFVNEAYKLGKREFLYWMKLHKEVEKTIERAKANSNDTPKLYIMGSEDHMFLSSVEEKLNTSKNEKLSIIKECGHVCNIERYKEFNQRTLSFLLQPINVPSC